MKDLQRRKFIKGAAVLSGAAICGVATANSAKAADVLPENFVPPPMPWGYQELDPEYVRKLGHLGYYLEECGGGSFWAIMTALKEKIGYPYTLVPLPTKEQFIEHLEAKKRGEKPKHYQGIMQHGVGGVADYGSLCGAANGAAAAVMFAFPAKDMKPIVQRLMRYYETEAFPNAKSNEYAVNNEFLVPKYKSQKSLLRSASHSVLCHVSVAKWCEKSGYASGSKERSERCARITGDTAAMAVTLLNAHLKGNLETVFPMKLSEATVSCRVCHFKGKKFEAGQFSRGSMECASCHNDMTPHLAENKLKTAYGTDVGTWAGAAVVGTVAGIGAHAVAGRFSKEEPHDEE
ncbi:MAG: C-GCAxxG-C-C family (seleno)protein [Thermodesulfobacteriota bacterium]|nr:C-GCAxxG-C-C family (seleno)protein [Thermodesulfobacteriota bacterium]